MRKVIIAILSVVVIVGISIAIFPSVAKIINNNSITTTASQVISNNSSAMQTELLDVAHKYNEQLTSSNNGSKYDDYYNILNTNGVMGVVSIPNIKLTLPIYHGISDDVLRKGAGHLPYTPFPIGDNGVSVITSHSGLPNATLFTNLSNLQQSDSIVITVAGISTTYIVDKIDVVEPSKVVKATEYSNDGKSYIALVTCTPIGVNTHRLVVRAVKQKAEVTSETMTSIQTSVPTDTVNLIVLSIIPLVILAVLVFILIRRKKCVK